MLSLSGLNCSSAAVCSRLKQADEEIWLSSEIDVCKALKFGAFVR